VKNPIYFKRPHTDDRLSVDLDAIILVTEMSATNSCFLKVKDMEEEIEIGEEYDVVMDRIRLYAQE
jgi:hypothetical protein